MFQQSSAALRSLDSWQQWEGRVVAGHHVLGPYIGGSDHSAVYLADTPVVRAVMKLVAAETGDGPAQLARWETACSLSHPNLLRIFETGRWHADDEQDMFFASMDCADETLSEILAERALTTCEVREMLEPALAALEYLHVRNLVLGCLKPSNVMAVGEQLKLAVDGVRRSGTRLTNFEQDDWRAAPELFDVGVSPRDDIWAVGLLVVESLTRQRPKLERSGHGAVGLPDGMPEPFRGIAQACLQRDPARRCSIADIRQMLVAPAEAVKPAQIVPMLPVSRMDETHEGSEPDAESAATGKLTQPITESPDIRPAEPVGVKTGERATWIETHAQETDQPEPSQPLDLKHLLDEEKPARRGNRKFVPIAVAMFVAVIAVFVLTMLVGRHGEQTKSQEVPKTAVPATNSASVQSSHPAVTPRTRITPGAVAHELLPEVLRSAQNSIHGVVRVRVELDVDSSGEAGQARLKAYGPSRYFARQALDAARHWKFAPPIVDGAPVASKWTIEFDFRRSGVKAEPKMIAPGG